MKKYLITADCVCDMPEQMLERYGIRVIYFYVITEHGWFKDRDEITSDNIVEYFLQGGKEVKTKAPFVEEYEAFFSEGLREAEQIIHINMSSVLSLAHVHATEAAAKFGGRVHVVDSKHFSTGMAHLVIKATELADWEKSADEIIAELEHMRQRITTGFIAEGAEYLYRTGNVGRFVRNMCEWLKMHPVLVIRKGAIKLKTVKFGNYDKAVLRYVRGEMIRRRRIDHTRLFITHASCSIKLLTKVKREVNRNCGFDDVSVTEASATISGNCGPNTIGVLYVKNDM